MVLVVDQRPEQWPPLPEDQDNIERLHPEVLLETARGTLNLIWKEPHDAMPDRVRWALKPIFLRYLLESRGMAVALYLDNDLHFVADYHFLFEEAARHAMLLTPHFFASRPALSPKNFASMFTVAYFNAGFVGATRKGFEALDWWWQCCLYKCEISAEEGLFGDQRYLDYLPLRFDNIGIVRHPGCNMGPWSQAEFPRLMNHGDATLISGKWPVIFIHFSLLTYEYIWRDREPLLNQWYDEHVAFVKKYDPSYDPLRSTRRQKVGAFWDLGHMPSKHFNLEKDVRALEKMCWSSPLLRLESKVRKWFSRGTV